MHSQQMEIFPTFIKFYKDVHSAYHIQALEPVEQKQFLNFVIQLSSSVNKNKKTQNQIKAIWVYLSPPKLHLVGELCQNGFVIHKGINQQIVMNKWISQQKNLIPPFSIFYTGCGAVLIKDDSIFMVQQKSGQRKGKFNIPGGRADFGEIISECVERQLFQETNIRAKFKYILHFRETTHSIYNSLDTYFACLMEFDDEALKQLKLCERELQDYKWVPLGEYLEFTKEKNCSKTQVMLAEYITKLWKEGFDFNKSMPNLTKVIQQKNKTGETKKVAYHQPINKFS